MSTSKILQDEELAKKRAYHRAWRLRNPGKAAAATKKWRLAHPERAIEVSRKSEANRNIEKRRATRRKWYASNPEAQARQREFIKRWRVKNSGRQKELSRRWYENNRQKHRELARLWALNNQEKARDSHRKWKAANPEQVKADNAARNNRIRGVGGKITAAQVMDLHEKQRGKCRACSKRLGMKYHLDHIMPLVLGGEHRIENVQLLCPKCNMAKHAMHPDDWAKRIGKLFV